MVNNNKHSVLMNKEGKFVTVRKVKSKERELQLCAVDSQNEYSVFIETREGDKNQVAFRFKHGDAYYSPKVVGEKLMVNKLESSTVFTNSHWFEKVDVKDGAYYSLKSVDKPTHYLAHTADTKGKYEILCICTENWVRLKEEARGSSF